MSFAERIAYRTVRIVACLGGAAVVGFNSIPHFFPDRFIKSRYSLHHPIPEKHKKYEKFVKDICSDMKIDSSKIQLFYYDRYNSYSGGCFDLPHGAVIGLPRNLAYKNIRTIKMECDDKSIVSWDSKIGQALERSMTLSDEQIKFLIAKELSAIKDLDFVYKAAHGVGIVTASYFVGNFTARIYRRMAATTHSATLLKRLVLIQFAAFGAGLVSYYLTLKPLCHWLVYKNDEVAAKLRPDFRQGGIDFMKQKIKYHRLILKIQGPSVERLYSEKGENNFTPNQPFLSDRKKRLKELV